MIVFETIIVAFSMFSAIPMPCIPWNEKNMRYSLCAFPLVGLAIGGICWLWVWLSKVLVLPTILQGAGLCLLPVLLTGGIHLDGYADTCDALASHAGPDRRQEILKDPHLGAFAAIRLCAYFAASFALWTALPNYSPVILLNLFCLSRTLSALALTLFPLRAGSGLARSFAEAADKKRVRNALLLMLAALCAVMIINACAMAVIAAALMFWYYYRISQRKFGGLSGDLAGWFLQKAELWMLAALCLGQYGENLL